MEEEKRHAANYFEANKLDHIDHLAVLPPLVIFLRVARGDDLRN